MDGDLDRYKEDVKKLITTEIVKRYYYQEGELIENLKGDKALQKALEVLTNEALYRQTLSAPKPEKEEGRKAVADRAG